MEFIKAMQIKKRMCKATSCMFCPMSGNHNRADMPCGEFIKTHPERVEVILKKWDKEHPQKTFQDDFFEKFPNAPKDEDGTPKTCLCYCGYVPEDFPCSADCIKCWSQPLEEN